MFYERNQGITNIAKLMIITISMCSLIYASAAVLFYDIIFGSDIDKNFYDLKELGFFAALCVIACLFISSLQNITPKQMIYYFVIPLFLLFIFTILLMGYIIYILNTDIAIIGSPLLFALISLFIVWGSSMMIEA